MAYTPKGYSSDMTDRQFRSFAKRQGMGQSEIDTYGAIDPDTGRRVFESIADKAQTAKKEIETKKASKKARQALPQQAPAKHAPDKPLSREALAALAGYGISGPRTYNEAFTHLEEYAKKLGYESAVPTRRNTSTELTNEAEQVGARLASRDNSPKISGDDASLLDQAHTLHVITKGMAVHSEGRPIRMPHKPTHFTPSGASSPEVQRVTRPDYTPPSGRPLLNLDAIPVPMTEGVSPRNAKAVQGHYEGKMKERLDLMANLSEERTERVSRTLALKTGAENAVMSGKLWSYDPDDGGWAHRDAPAPINPRKDSK